MKPQLYICLLLLLLAACTPQEVALPAQTVSSAPASPTTAVLVSAQTTKPVPPVVTSTRLPNIKLNSPCFTYNITPAIGCGTLFPFTQSADPSAPAGLCDSHGRVVVPPIYASVTRYDYTSNDFLYALEQPLSDGSTQLRIIADDASMVSVPYPNASVNSVYADKGTGYVLLQTLTGYTLLREDGKEVLTDAPNVVSSMSEGLLAVQTPEGYRYMDGNGSVILSGPYDEAGSFHEGLAVVRKDGAWGVIDPHGQWVITPQYEAAMTFGGGVCAVRSGGNWGLIDTKGQAVLPFDYSSISKIDTDVYLLQRESPEGSVRFYFDAAIGKVVPYEPSLQYLTGGNLAANQSDGVKLHLERTQSTEFIAEATQVTPLTNNLLVVRFGNGAGLYEIGKGFLVQPTQYQKIYLSQKIAVIGSGSHLGAVSFDGKISLPMRYNSITPLEGNLFAVFQDGYKGIIDENETWLLRFDTIG